MDAPVYRIEADTYHADKTHLTNSDFQVFGESALLFYKRRYKGEFLSKPAPATQAAYDFGSLFDWILLRDGPIGGGVKVIPENVLSSSGSKAGKKWKAFEQKWGQTHYLLKRGDKEGDRVYWMLEGVKRSEQATVLIDYPGEYQREHRWTDHRGLQRKIRVDKLIHTDDLFVMIDHKTTSAETHAGFAKSATNFGYPGQVAYYLDGIEDLTGERPPATWIASRKNPPYSTSVYEVPPDVIEHATKKNDRLLDELARYQDKYGTLKEWPERDAGEVITLEFPKYYFMD